MDLRRNLVPLTYRHPLLHGSLRKAKHVIESTLARWQPAERHDVSLDPALQLRLQDFYRDDVLRLATLTGQTPPWPDFFPGGRSTTR